jgi:trigger factor
MSQESNLKFEIVNISGCKRNLVAEASAEETNRKIDEFAREYAQKVKVPGFRPGKVPLNVIKQRFANDLRSDATQEIIRLCWKNALSEHDLHPLAEPAIENVQNEPDGSLKFQVTFEVLPAVEIKDYKGISISAPQSKVEDADVDESLMYLQDQNAQYVPVEDAQISDGHYVSFSYEVEIPGRAKPIHEEEGACIVGDSRTEEAFSQNLRGAKVGDTRSFEVSYPEDYRQRRLAGKTAGYKLTIKEVKEKQLASLNDEFAKDIGAESLEALKVKIKDDLVTKAQRNAEKSAREAAIDSILERHSFDVPECLIQDEFENYVHQIAANLAQQGIDINKTSIDWKKMFEQRRPQSEKEVRRSIALDAIARQEGIDISAEELDAEFEKLSEGSGKSAAAIKAQFEKDERIQGFRELLRRNKALDFVYRNANITGE